jgi:methylated-DNA-[protein]-cysteine S-methyltransferase
MRNAGPTFALAAEQFQTPCGWIGLVASEQGLYEIFIGSCQDAVQERLNSYHPASDSRAGQLWLAEARLAIEAYFADPMANRPVSFDWRGLTKFAIKVLQCLSNVPVGQVISYAELARRVGSPGAARAVGRVMANNPFPILVPCHRVLGSDGKMTGYSGGKGIATKQLLLAHENVQPVK